MRYSTSTAWVLFLLFGGFGAHKFYLGKPGQGLLFMVTFGGLGIWTLIDIFTLHQQVRAANVQIFRNMNVMHSHTHYMVSA